jgi:secreted trypsin-like serine protease
VVVNEAHAASSARVTNGKPTSSSAYDARWGFIVSVQLVYPSAKPSDIAQHECGGSLIAPDLVLTAEHCTPDSVGTLPLTTMKLQVLAGHRTLRTGAVTTADRADVVDVWHYEPAPTGYGSVPLHDVAILKLAHPIDAPTIQLVGADQRASWGAGGGLRSGAMVAGWGIASTQPYDDDFEDDEELADGPPSRSSTVSELRETGIPIVADRVCETTNSKMYFDAVDFDSSTMLCAGALDSAKGSISNRRGACFGDSGGPLIVPDGIGGWRLAGVVSWGPDHGGGCNSYSIFARVDAMREWITSVIAANGPARTAPAPRSLTATPYGVNKLRITWPAATAGSAPQHVELIREYTKHDEYTDLGYEPTKFASVINPRIRAELKAWDSTHQNLTLAVGGSSTRSLIAVGIAPHRSGVSKHVRLRIATHTRAGVTDVSPTIVVDAPLDDTAPARPHAPRAIGTQRGAVKLWWHKSADNDCVRRYIVQVRRAGSPAWKNRSSRDAQACPDIENLLSGADSDSWSARIESVLARMFGRPNDFRATRLAAGVYQVRIVAEDRAGNRATGAASTVRVPKTITAAADKLSSVDMRKLLMQAFDAVMPTSTASGAAPDSRAPAQSSTASVTLTGF